MKSKAITAARTLLGLVFLVFGVNGFLNFLPQPPMPGRAGELVGGLAASGYVFPLMFVIYTIAGAGLLVGRFVPLALVLLAPIIVNIVAIHLFLAPSGLPLALAVLGLEVFLAWSYRTAFRPVLRARQDASPTAVEPAPVPHAIARAR